MKKALAFMLGLLMAVAAWGDAPRLVVKEYALAADAELFPAQDPGRFAGLVDSVCAANGLVRRAEAGDSTSALPDTMSFRTANGVVWTVRRTGSLVGDGRGWTRADWARILDSLAIHNPEYRKRAKSFDEFYELLRGDSVVGRFTTSSVDPPGLVSAFAWGDSAVLEYIGHGAHYVLMNGVDLNAEGGYESCFAFHILAGRPFYFYRRNGEYGWCYDGQEFGMGYRIVSHDYRGAAAEFNPVVRPEIFRAIAQRGDTWYLLDGSKK